MLAQSFLTQRPNHKMAGNGVTMELMGSANGKDPLCYHHHQCSYPMNGGDGPSSYSKNSIYQRQVVDGAKTLITDAIKENLNLENSPMGYTSTIKIADFGSSVGPNTFMAVENIIQAIQLKNQTLEFQVFFNDLGENDFNTLFKTLPNPRPYFAAGVPGSFHSRLFPEASIHVAHSSQALNWLSRVPEEVLDKNSPKWNKGRVHYNESSEIFEAFSGQYKRDMKAFFDARAHEIVDGGIMLLLIPGCEDGFPPFETPCSLQFGLFWSCLMDMVNMGIIREDQIDSFNFPLYQTCPVELRELIDLNGSFDIESMENFNPYALDGLPNFHTLAKHLRAATEELIKCHFGNKIICDLFERFVKKLAENTVIFDASNKQIIIFLYLKRKARQLKKRDSQPYDS